MSDFQVGDRVKVNESPELEENSHYLGTVMKVTDNPNLLDESPILVWITWDDMKGKRAYFPEYLKKL